MSTSLASAPLARAPSRQPWARLALLATVLTMSLASIALVIAWLVPPTINRTFEYPLADLEVGVPAFYRPFDMGGKSGKLDGIWLVRFPDDTVRAFWSRTAHPGGCVIELALVPPLAPGPPHAIPPTAVPTPRAPGFAEPPPAVGFREPCLSSTFLLDGTRTFGPAPRGLDSFPTTIENGTVTVDVTRFILGTCGTTYPECSPPANPRLEPARWPRPQ